MTIIKGRPEFNVGGVQCSCRRSVRSLNAIMWSSLGHTRVKTLCHGSRFIYVLFEVRDRCERNSRMGQTELIYRYTSAFAEV